MAEMPVMNVQVRYVYVEDPHPVVTNWFWSTPARQPTPHCCPVCGGRGKVLFDPDNPYMTTNTNAGPWTCRPCLGSGIVWQ